MLVELSISEQIYILHKHEVRIYVGACLYCILFASSVSIQHDYKELRYVWKYILQFLLVIRETHCAVKLRKC